MPPPISIAAVLYLQPLTRSIFLRPYLRNLGEKPILAVLAERILQRCRAKRFLVVYHYDSEREALEQALAGTGAELRHTSHFVEIKAMSELASEIEEEEIACLQLGVAIAPADLLVRVHEHHLRHKNSFTLLEGIPSECLLGLYNRDVLQHLASMTEKTDFFSPELALRTLLVYGDKGNMGKPPFSLDMKPFHFLGAYQIPPEALPQGMFLREKLEYELVQQAFAAAHEDGSDPDSPDILRRIKQLQVRRKSALHQLPEAFRLKLPRRGKSERARVLFMSPPSAFSGAEQALCSMAKFLDPRRFELSAVVDHNGVFAEKLRSLGVEVVCPEREILIQDIERFSYMLELYRDLRPDILHLNGRGTMPIVAAALLYGVPIVQHVRNGDLRGFEDGMLAASSIVCITEFLKREALKLPIRGDRVQVIYDEVDSEFYDPTLFDKAACRKEYGLDPDAPTALMVARVVPNKRYDVMLRAAALIRQRIPNFQLVLKGDIYGDSVHHRKIKALADELKLTDCVRWFDFVPEIRTLFAAADVLVLCSDREGLGSCVVEAQSMALPVVVTNSGGTHEIVESGVSGGYVIPGGDHGQLAARVVELLNDVELRQRLGQAGRAYVQRRLDARISAASMMEIYDSLLKKS